MGEWLLELADRLALPELSQKARLALVTLMLCLLNGHRTAQVEMKIEQIARGEWIPPPRVPVLANADTA